MYNNSGAGIWKKIFKFSLKEYFHILSIFPCSNDLWLSLCCPHMQAHPEACYTCDCSFKVRHVVACMLGIQNPTNDYNQLTYVGLCQAAEDHDAMVQFHWGRKVPQADSEWNDQNICYLQKCVHVLMTKNSTCSLYYPFINTRTFWDCNMEFSFFKSGSTAPTP